MGPERVHFEAEVVIIGGGTAGCLAAVTIKEQAPTARVIIMEKADIRRSGCLAAGVNVIKAYLHPGETPESFLKDIRHEARGLVREDLVLSAAKRLNEVVEKVERWGLSILKNANGAYLPHGRWGIKVDGEKLKPLLAEKVKEKEVKVLNRVAATNYLLSKEGRVIGVAGIGVRDACFYIIKASTILCTTGGCAGLYRSRNPVDGHHQIWYSPFNTGSGYAMGIRAGAEMTSFEMRFIALTIKDVASSISILTRDCGAYLLNSYGQQYLTSKNDTVSDLPFPSCLSLFAYLQELKEGRGPCFLETRQLTDKQVRELKESYLNENPATVLYWVTNGVEPEKKPVEISSTEPYIVGGHGQAGYWIDQERRTTIGGVYACGDVAGGYPSKYIGGSWAEAIIAGETIVDQLTSVVGDHELMAGIFLEEQRVFAPLERYRRGLTGIEPWEMEERLQKIMEEYAGGISCRYELSEPRLLRAKEDLSQLNDQVSYLLAKNSHQLMKAHEVLDLLDVAKVTVEHLLYRRETRWPGFQTRVDYPERCDLHWRKFINSRRNHNGAIEMIERPYHQLI
jgi:adenylylsulfate reductase subunit A